MDGARALDERPHLHGLELRYRQLQMGLCRNALGWRAVYEELGEPQAGERQLGAVADAGGRLDRCLVGGSRPFAIAEEPGRIAEVPPG